MLVSRTDIYWLLTSTPPSASRLSWPPCSLSTCGYRRSKHATFVMFTKRETNASHSWLTAIVGNTTWFRAWIYRRIYPISKFDKPTLWLHVYQPHISERVVLLRWKTLQFQFNQGCMHSSPTCGAKITLLIAIGGRRVRHRLLQKEATDIDAPPVWRFSLRPLFYITIAICGRWWLL